MLVLLVIKISVSHISVVSVCEDVHLTKQAALVGATMTRSPLSQFDEAAIIISILEPDCTSTVVESREVS